MSRSRKYVHSFTDRYGQRRHYFRRGGKQIPLPGLFGSPEFVAAYEAALAGVTIPPPVGVNRTKPGTVNAAVVGYYRSLAFRELAPATQTDRRNILEHFRGEPYNFGNNQIATLTSQFIVKLLNQRTATQRAQLAQDPPSMARLLRGRRLSVGQSCQRHQIQAPQERRISCVERGGDRRL
jgi:hypothetical protein